MVEQKSKNDKQRNLLQVGGVFVFLTVVALFFICNQISYRPFLKNLITNPQLMWKQINC